MKRLNHFYEQSTVPRKALSSSQALGSGILLVRVAVLLQPLEGSRPSKKLSGPEENALGGSVWASNPVKNDHRKSH